MCIEWGLGQCKSTRARDISVYVCGLEVLEHGNGVEKSLLRQLLVVFIHSTVAITLYKRGGKKRKHSVKIEIAQNCQQNQFCGKKSRRTSIFSSLRCMHMGETMSSLLSTTQYKWYLFTLMTLLSEYCILGFYDLCDDASFRVLLFFFASLAKYLGSALATYAVGDSML